MNEEPPTQRFYVQMGDQRYAIEVPASEVPAFKASMVLKRAQEAPCHDSVFDTECCHLNSPSALHDFMI